MRCRRSATQSTTCGVSGDGRAPGIVARRVDRHPAPSRGMGRRPAARARRPGLRQDARAYVPRRPPARCVPRSALSHPRPDVYQRGGARDGGRHRQLGAGARRTRHGRYLSWLLRPGAASARRAPGHQAGLRDLSASRGSAGGTRRRTAPERCAAYERHNRDAAAVDRSPQGAAGGAGAGGTTSGSQEWRGSGKRRPRCVGLSPVRGRTSPRQRAGLQLAHSGDAPAVRLPGAGRALSGGLPILAGRRVPGHQRSSIRAAPPHGRRELPGSLCRRRRRSDESSSGPVRTCAASATWCGTSPAT